MKRPRNFSSATRLVAANILIAVVGTLSFGILHAIVIVPIWNRLAGGFPFALAAAAAITLSYRYLRRINRLPAGRWGAICFGAFLWLSTVPTTILGLFLRLTRLHNRNDALEVIGSLLVAVVTGAAMARMYGLRSRALLAFSFVPAVLVIAMAGPVPVSNGARPILLLLGFLFIFVTAAFAVSLLED